MLHNIYIHVNLLNNRIESYRVVCVFITFSLTHNLFNIHVVFLLSLCFIIPNKKIAINKKECLILKMRGKKKEKIIIITWQEAASFKCLISTVRLCFLAKLSMLWPSSIHIYWLNYEIVLSDLPITIILKNKFKKKLKGTIS